MHAPGLEGEPGRRDEGRRVRGHDALPGVGGERLLARLREGAAGVLHVVDVLHLRGAAGGACDSERRRG